MTIKKDYRSRRSVLSPALLALCGVLAYVPVSQAGFEFIAPIMPDIEKKLLDEEAAMKKEKPGTSDQALQPLPALGDAQQAEVGQTGVSQEMLLPIEGPPAFVSDMQGTKTVEGFARDVPLVLAVTQIVPPDYKFVFDEEIDPGMVVDWQGGQSWDLVLENLTRSYNLHIAIADKVVYIKKPQSTNFAQYFAPKPPPSPFVPDETGLMPSKEPVVAQNADEGPISLAQDLSEGEDDLEAIDMAEMSFGDPLPLLPDLIDGMPATVDDEDEGYKMTSLRPDQITKKGLSIGKSKKDQLEDPKNIWKATSGQTLRAILKNWSESLGVSLVWAADFDYPVQAEISIKGSYVDAVTTLLDGLSDANPRPLGRLHKNKTTGKPVLIVETGQLTS